MKKAPFLLLLFFLTIRTTAQDRTVSSIQELFRIADTSSYIMTEATLQEDLASLTSKAAMGNVINPRIPVTAGITDNTNLQVTFLPAEIFGGPTGTFREVTMGQQYITSLNISPQFDIINPSHIADLRSANLNKEASEIQTKLSRKELYDQINALYHNILTLQEQIIIFDQHVSMADGILKTVLNKKAVGIARPQDINDAMIQVLQYQNKKDQAIALLRNQYLTLQAIMDSPSPITIIDQLSSFTPQLLAPTVGSFVSNQLQLTRQAAAKQTLQSHRLNQLPTLSFVSNLAWQNNSNVQFFDNDQRWINATYWGLRLTWEFPTNVQKMTAVGQAKLNFQIAEEQLTHVQLLNATASAQMESDYNKALNDYEAAKAIFELEESSYNHLNNQYQSDIISLDKLLLGHAKFLNAQLNVASALSVLSFQFQKITIHNTVR